MLKLAEYERCPFRNYHLRQWLTYRSREDLPLPPCTAAMKDPGCSSPLHHPPTQRAWSIRARDKAQRVGVHRLRSLEPECVAALARSRNRRGRWPGWPPFLHHGGENERTGPKREPRHGGY